MEEAYREYVTTSPSYHLLASADAAVRALAADGEAALGACIDRTRALKAALRERLPRARPPRRRGLDCGRARPNVAGCDLVKTTVGSRASTSRASTVAEALVERGIVVEKAGVQHADVHHDVPARRRARSPTRCDALAEVLAGHELPGGARRPAPGNPFAALDDRPVMHPYAARRYAKSIGHEVPLEEAVGQRRGRDRRGLSARHPADPRGLPRQRATPSATCCEARDMGGAIVARDTSLATLRVL